MCFFTFYQIKSLHFDLVNYGGEEKMGLMLKANFLLQGKVDMNF